MRSLLLAIALSNAFVVQCFIPQSDLRKSASVGRIDRHEKISETALLLAQPKEQEKQLRQELAERTSKLADEEQYALRDGPVVVLDETEEEEETAPAPEQETELERLVRRMGRLTKRRAYPLFLAEKAVELVENIIPKPTFYPAKKEKIVVLGTGWGAVSFLKGIDTSLYDVTVISPRNYFLFTPMLGKHVLYWRQICPLSELASRLVVLTKVNMSPSFDTAGASVGTVDYRSITEPVREVRP